MLSGSLPPGKIYNINVTVRAWVNRMDKSRHEDIKKS